jgi:polar amino acid transport system substrate-binding protein
MTQPHPTEEARRQLAPTGVLRAGINMTNFLLVSSRGANDEPLGVSPDMAKALADALGVPLQKVPYPGPGQVADAAGTDAWDIALIGAEPQRAEKITFTAAYAEIQATYLVPAGSPIQSIAEVDRPGIRIVTSGRAAYGLWLERNIHQATLVKADSLDDSLARFRDDGMEVLGGLRSRLVVDQKALPGSRILDGQFMAVQQAIGTAKPNEAGAAYLSEFVAFAKSSGLVAALIARHGVDGLSVAS